MSIIVRADMPLGTDDRPAAGTTRASGCDDAGDLMGECLGGGKCGATSEDRVIVFILLEVMGEDRDPLTLLIVSNRHLADDVFRDIRRQGCRTCGWAFGDARLHVPSEPKLFEKLLDCKAEGLKLLLLHPQRDEVEAYAGNQAEATLARFADCFRFEDSELLVFVSSNHHRLHRTADPYSEDTLAGAGSGRRPHGEVGDGCGRGGRTFATDQLVQLATLGEQNTFHYTRRGGLGQVKRFASFRIPGAGHGKA